MEGECSICMCDLSSPTVLNCCYSVYCAQCIVNWAKNTPTCPMCRGKINKDTIIGLGLGKESKSTTVVRQTTKIETLIDIIKTARKTLIYSEFDNTFEIVTNRLNDEKIPYEDLKGTKLHREKVLRNYKTGNLDILLINSRNNGAGLNLQNTTDIVLMHSMVPELQQQII